MADNKFRGFEAIADNLLKPDGEPSMNSDEDPIPFTDPEDIKKNDPVDPTDPIDPVDPVDPKTDPKVDPVDPETDPVDPIDPVDPVDPADPVDPVDPVDPTDPVDIDDKFESDITKFFQQKLHEELGWEFEEDQAFDSVEAIVDYMGELVETASKPRYANEEVGKIDQFVKDGGKIEDYYNAINTGTVDVDNVDLTKESNQRLVVEEHLKTLGYTQERVKRYVDRYEDRGTLEDEAEDALELLKEYKEKNKEKLLEDQKNRTADMQKEQQKFISNVEDTIDNISDIAGYALTKAEKSALKEYIFKPTKDGRTQYQIDYSTDQEKNLIESAFFTKNKDAILEKTKRKASTDTLKEFQQKLRSESKRTKNVRSPEKDTGSVALSKLGQLISKN